MAKSNRKPQASKRYRDSTSERVAWSRRAEQTGEDQ